MLHNAVGGGSVSNFQKKKHYVTLEWPLIIIISNEGASKMSVNASKTDAVAVAVVTEPTLVVNHRHDAAVVLNENRLFDEPHGQR